MSLRAACIRLAFPLNSEFGFMLQWCRYNPKDRRQSSLLKKSMCGREHLCVSSGNVHHMSVSSFVPPPHLSTHDECRTTQIFQRRVSRRFDSQRQNALCLFFRVHCFAFFRMVPTAEITVVLVPLAVVVTDTTAGRVAVVVMRVGWASVTGIAESHLLFLFWASACENKHRGVRELNHQLRKGPTSTQWSSPRFITSCMDVNRNLKSPCGVVDVQVSFCFLLWVGACFVCIVHTCQWFHAIRSSTGGGNTQQDTQQCGSRGREDEHCRLLSANVTCEIKRIQHIKTYFKTLVPSMWIVFYLEQVIAMIKCDETRGSYPGWPMCAVFTVM